MANEKRLIPLQKRIIYAGDVFNSLMEEKRWSVTEATCFMKAFRTVDAVEVVHCGQCKQWVEIEETGGAGYCQHPCWTIAGEVPPIVQFADFCSYGERKDDGKSIRI